MIAAPVPDARRSTVDHEAIASWLYIGKLVATFGSSWAVCPIEAWREESNPRATQRSICIGSGDAPADQARTSFDSLRRVSRGTFGRAF
jgi:hypothetical protein